MKPSRRAIRFTCIAVLGLGCLGASPADANLRGGGHHGLQGVITFSRFDENGAFQVWVANADLTNQQQLTAGDSTSGFSTWKPDGSRLAFDSDRSDPDRSDDVFLNDVFTMNPDGTDVVQVTHVAGGFSGDPDWSPDGKWLTYQSDLGDYPARQGIYVSRPDGSHLRRVTTLPAGYEFDGAPQFSPDGKRIVFTRYHLDDQGNETSALYIANLDGSPETRLDTTADLHPGDANWSPDGKTLVFEDFGPIFTIRADGTHLRNLTKERPDGFSLGSDPVYSPDGRQIMYLSSDRTNQGEILSIGLSVMKKNGNQLRYVTDTPTEATQEHQPDWIRAPRLRGSASKAPATERQVAPTDAHARGAGQLQDQATRS